MIRCGIWRMPAWTGWPTWRGWRPRFAALKVLLAADYAQATRALAPPAASLHDAKCQEMAVTAEVACALTVSEGTAGRFWATVLALTTRSPLTLKALQAGTISWAHARAMVDETANLDPAGAAALEAHFLDPDAPNPARGARPGTSSRTGSARKCARGANATTRTASNNATPKARRTGGSNSARTLTGWPGSPRTCRPIPPRGSGTGPPPPPAPCRARPRPAP